MNEEQKKKKVNINIQRNPEHDVPLFSNLMQIHINYEKKEVVIDFIYYDERIKEKDDSIRGFQVARIALSKERARDLNKTLSELLERKIDESGNK